MSAECERVFSRINLLIGDDRRSLAADSVEVEVPLHKWQLARLIVINKDATYAAVIARHDYMSQRYE